jgi:hypothetical protein
MVFYSDGFETHRYKKTDEVIKAVPYLIIKTFLA